MISIVLIAIQATTVALPSPRASSPLGVGQAAPDRLLVGDMAPDLERYASWIRDDPVPVFEPGRVYVLDLWATWCLSCVARMPHLSELALAHRDDGLTVIGIAVLQQDAAMTVDDFLRIKPDSMQYTVARELVEGAVPRLFQGLDEPSIPFLVIVGRDRRIAWRSNPRDAFAGFEGALGAVLDGSWDLQAAAARDRRLAQVEADGQTLLRRIAELGPDPDPDPLRPLVGELVSLDPTSFGSYTVDLFRAELRTGRASAFEYARKASSTVIAHAPAALLALGRAIADSGPATEAEWAVAVEAAERADEIKQRQDPDFTWALAQVQFAAGRAGAAVDTMDKAIEKAQVRGWDESVLMLMRRDRARFASRGPQAGAGDSPAYVVTISGPEGRTVDVRAELQADGLRCSSGCGAAAVGSVVRRRGKAHATRGLAK